MENIIFENSQGDKLSGILSNPKNSDTVVILAHGFNSHKNKDTYLTYEKLINSIGYASFRFDFYGHGESEGKFEDITVSEGIDDILSAISYLKKSGYKKIGLLGSSFGGATSLLAAAKTKDLHALVLRSAVSDYEAFERKRRGPAEIKKWEQDGFLEVWTEENPKKLNFSFFQDLKNHNGYTSGKNIHIPTLIMHGDKDTIVPVEQSTLLHKEIPQSKLLIIRGAGHRYTDEKKLFDQDLETVKEFLLRELAQQ